MRRHIFWILPLVLILLTGCFNSEKEMELNKKEEDLRLRENALLERENELAQLRQFKDSILLDLKINDSIPPQVWPDSLKGIWHSKVVCNSSDCADYVVGDQRSDVWNFKDDSTALYVEVTNNKNKIVRVYSAQLNQDNIQLRFQTDANSSKYVEMEILLNNFKTDKITGTRNVQVNKTCQANFSVELSKQTKKK